MDPPRQQPGITLPVDIILLIIESLVPKNTQPILPASNPVTKTLVAFTRVCKATYPVASRLLWNFCLYIDSPDRATQFLRFLSSAPALPRARPWQAYDSASLFLAPYKEEDEEDDYDDYDDSDESDFVDRPGPQGVPAISSPPS
ncbi:F-box-like domain-containing, partial [Fusarium albosuccineum]